MADQLEKIQKLKFLQRRNSSVSDRDRLGILAIGAIVISALGLGVNFLMLQQIKAVESKPTPGLVELSSGESIRVSEIGSKERSPEAIELFTQQTLTMLFTWTGKLPSVDGGEPQIDKGVPVEGNKKISTLASSASFALSEDFRADFLLALAGMMPSNVFSSSAQVVWEPIEIGKPVKIAEGEWQVDIVSNLIVFKPQDLVGSPIQFNKRITIRAVERPAKIDGVEGFNQTLRQVRQAGLEITQIQDLI